MSELNDKRTLATDENVDTSAKSWQEAQTEHVLHETVTQHV